LEDNKLIKIIKLMDNKIDSQDFLLACKTGNIESVRCFLNDNCVNPSVDDDAAIISASLYGHRDLVELLLNDDRVNPSARDNCAIISAAARGHAKIVQLLLNDRRRHIFVRDDVSRRIYELMADPSGSASMREFLSKHLFVDSSMGDVNTKRIFFSEGTSVKVEVKYTAHGVNPSARNNEALELAALNRHIETVKLLIEDPQVNLERFGNSLLRRAERYGYSEIAELLLKKMTGHTSPSVCN
jgi:ankyrin repeat protein